MNRGGPETRFRDGGCRTLISRHPTFVFAPITVALRGKPLLHMNAATGSVLRTLTILLRRTPDRTDLGDAIVILPVAHPPSQQSGASAVCIIGKTQHPVQFARRKRGSYYAKHTLRVMLIPRKRLFGSINQYEPRTIISQDGRDKKSDAGRSGSLPLRIRNHQVC